MALRAGSDLEDLVMPSTMLTIVSTMVGFEGWREQPGNKARLLLAEQVMIWAREKARAHLIVFPAGFLCATDVAEARALAGRAMALAKQRSLAVVVGVDLCTTGEFQRGLGKVGSEDIDLLVSQGQLPFFLYAWSPYMPTLTEWRQRSTTGENGELVPPKESCERRLLKVHGHWVDVVACGEGFNRALRASIEQDPKKTAAVVIASHTYQGSRIWNATQHFSSVVGLPTLLSVHQVGSQYGQMRLPSSADYVDAQMHESFGSAPHLHAGAFTMPARTGQPKQHGKMIMAASRSMDPSHPGCIRPRGRLVHHPWNVSPPLTCSHG
jgi:hypothetical protein